MVGNRFYRYRYYFLRGHNQWLILFLSFSNFIVIQYSLFVTTFIKINIGLFALLFTGGYVSMATLVGYWDMNNNFKVEQTMVETKSPLFQKILSELAEIKQEVQKK